MPKNDNKSYTWNAEGYANHSLPQQKWGLDLFAKLSLQGDERLLDIGCGDGKVTAEMARSLPKGSVVGIDSSKEMIKLARSKYSQPDFQNIQFRYFDALDLPLDNKFDIIISNATLHWIQDHYSVLLGIRLSLKPGGKVLLQMGGKGNAAGLFQAVDRAINSRKWQEFFVDFSHPYAFYSPEQYQEWLEKVGLQPIRTDLIPKTMIHKSPAALMSWLEKVFIPYLEKVPKPKQQDFIKEIVEKYLENHPFDEKGRTKVQMIRLEVEADKENT